MENPNKKHLASASSTGDCSNVVSVLSQNGPQQPEIHFDNLPIEIKEEIFKHLDLGVKQTLRLVSHSIRDIIDHKLDFKVTLSDDTYDCVRDIHRDKMIQELIVQDCSKKIIYTSRSRSNFSKTVKHLRFMSTEGTSKLEDESICSICGSDDHNDVIWEPGIGTSEDNIINLLKLHPDILELTIGSMSFQQFANVQNMARLKTIRLDLLTCFELLFGDELDETLINDKTSIVPYQQFLKNTFPSLLSFKYICKALNKPINLLIDIYRFVARHKSIQKLYIRSEKQYRFPLKNFTGHDDNKMYHTLLPRLCQIQLKELYLRVIPLIPLSFLWLKNLEKAFVNSQQRLEKAELVFVNSEMFSTSQFAPTLFNTLTVLTILCGYPYNLINNNYFDCSWIKNFKKLESLCLDMDFHEWGGLRRQRGKIINFENLPRTIKKLQLGGSLSPSETITIFSKLKNLKHFMCNGTGKCEDNMELFLSILRNSPVVKFQLLHEKCYDLLKTALLMREFGIEVYDNYDGFDFEINRSKLVGWLF